MNVIEETLILTDDCDCFKLTSGLFHYFIQTARNESDFFKVGLVFYPESKLEYGIKLLNQASKSNNSLISSEANYFLARIYNENSQYLNSAIHHYNILTTKYPNNLIYLYYELNAMINSGFPKEILLKKKEKALDSINKNSQLIMNQSNYFKKLFSELKF